MSGIQNPSPPPPPHTFRRLHQIYVNLQAVPTASGRQDAHEGGEEEECVANEKSRQVSDEAEK